MKNYYHNWETLVDMLHYELKCVEWVDKEQLLFKIVDKDLFVKCWNAMRDCDMVYENIARGLRFIFNLSLK